MLPAVPATSNLSSDSSDSGHEDGQPKKHHHHHRPRHHEEPFVNLSECTSLHEGRQLISTILPVNIDTLFRTLFERSKFLSEFHESRKLSDIKLTEWTLDEANRRRRTFKCKWPVKASFGPKTSSITELQTLRECSTPGSLYSIDITSYNENVPFGDTFTIYVHHCLVRTVDDHTMLSVYGVVKFRKSCFVRHLIERTTYNGLDDFHNDLALQLTRHFCSPPIRHERHSSQTPPMLAKSCKAEPLPNDQRTSKKSSASHFQSVSQTQENENAFDSAQRRGAWCILFLLVSVSIVNVVLYLRLVSLDARSGTPMFSAEKWLEDGVNFSSEDWIRILVTNEHLHQQRATAMRRSLISITDSITNTEKQLMEMVKIIAMPTTQMGHR